MITPKEQFFDRFDQSIKLLKVNFFPIFIPLFLYNFIYFIVWYFSFLKISSIGLSGIKDMESLDIFSFLNNSTIVIYIAFWIVFFLFYLMFYIPIQLQLIKSIRQSYAWDKITVQGNLLYWINRFFSSFSTYYYIFLYVAWIPAFIFIVWGILFNLTYFIELDDFIKELSIWLMILWLVLFVCFSIYRWLKSKFSIISAVDNDSYSKNNFNKSISYTKWNWWRIFWNILLVWFLINVIKWIIWSVIWLLWFLNSGVFDKLLTDYSSVYIEWWDTSKLLQPENLNKILDSLWEFNLVSFIWDIIKVWINSLGVVFITLFLYLLFKRLELENNWLKKLDNEVELINLEEEIKL